MNVSMGTVLFDNFGDQVSFRTGPNGPFTMVRLYGEEALALALMPEQSGSFLINGFRALAQNGDVRRDILLSRIAPQVYRSAQSTSGGAVAPSSGPAAQSSGQSAVSGSTLTTFIRNSLGSIPAAPVTDAITKAARNLLASSHDTIRQMAYTARTRPLLADGPQGYEENNLRPWIDVIAADELKMSSELGAANTAVSLTSGQENATIEQLRTDRIILSPFVIRFSQSSVNDSAYIIESMKKNGWNGEAIDIVLMPDGNYTTIDNTRVYAAQQAGIDVVANVHEFNETIIDGGVADRLSRGRFIPQTWGEAVLIRISSQNKAFRQNQYGDWIMMNPK